KVQAGHAIGGEIDGMTAVLQVVAEVGGDVLVVFDDENAHAGGFHEVGQAWTARWARGSTGQGRDSGTGPRRRRVDRARTKEPRRCHRLGPKVLPRSPQSVGRPWDKETGARRGVRCSYGIPGAIKRLLNRAALACCRGADDGYGRARSSRYLARF